MSTTKRVLTSVIGNVEITAIIFHLENVYSEIANSPLAPFYWLWSEPRYWDHPGGRRKCPEQRGDRLDRKHVHASLL